MLAVIESCWTEQSAEAIDYCTVVTEYSQLAGAAAGAVRPAVARENLAARTRRKCLSNDLIVAANCKKKSLH